MDIIYGYVLVADRALAESSSFDSFNFSSDVNNNYNVLKVANIFLKKFNINTIKINDNKEYFEKISLNINSSKAKKILDWKPLYDVEKAIKLTADWYIKKFR